MDGTLELAVCCPGNHLQRAPHQPLPQATREALQLRQGDVERLFPIDFLHEKLHSTSIRAPTSDRRQTPDTAMRGHSQLAQTGRGLRLQTHASYVCRQCRSIQISATPSTETPKVGGDAFGASIEPSRHVAGRDHGHG